MKRSSIIVLLSMLMSTVSVKASDYAISVKNSDGIYIYYKWGNNKTELGVSCYSTLTSQNAIHYYGDLNIPESVEYKGNTYPVTSIDAKAFQGCENLTSINIPASVTSIGADAFWLCNKLTSINIPTSVTSIGERAFKGCTTLVSVNIPINGLLSSIGARVFEGCSELTSVSLPKSLTTIGELAFYMCNNLTSINLPQGITTIETGTFNGCTSLNSINMPKSLTSIGPGAFADCNINKVIIEDISAWCNIQLNYKEDIDAKTYYSLGTNPLYNSNHIYKDDNTEITILEIPEGVTKISEFAFGGCAGIKEVKFPNSLTTINARAFEGCGLTTLNIPKNVNYVGYHAFYRCNNLTYVELHCNPGSSFSGNTSIKTLIIGDEVKSLSGFSGCTGLTSINIPNTVSFIGEEAFSGCTGLTSINIPNSMTAIAQKTFYGCSSLTSIIIPESITEIGLSAFQDCSNLETISIPNTVTSVGVDAFSGTKWYNNQNEGLIYIGGIAYEYKGTMPDNTTIVIKEGTKILNTNIFKECVGLSSITLPNSITSIGDFAFYGCTGLKTVNIPNGVTSIGKYAFDGCADISAITIPYSVTSIGEEAFENCCGLISLTIQNGVSTIGRSAFSGCTGLVSVTIPNSVTSDLYYTFEGCSKLKTVTISNNVEIIGHYAFRNCTSLESITIPNSVTSIYSTVFQGCTSLTSVTIPNSVKLIGDHAFSNCTNLNSVKLGDGLTSIGKYAFENTAITSIAIPNDVTEISEGAFKNCNKLITARLGDGVEKIRKEAFFDCASLVTIYLGKGVNNIYDTAFDNCNNLKNVIITSDNFPNFAPKIRTGYPTTYVITGMFIMKKSTYDAGIPSYVKSFATYNNIPMIIEVKSKSATSAVFNLYTLDEDGIIDEENMVTVTTLGQTPGQYLNWKKDKDNYGIISEKANETLILTVQEPKALSTKKARLLATVEEEADDMKHYGFEWRRYDAPDGVPSSKVSSPLYNGQIVGTLNNLNSEAYYKFRPFYKSDSGEMFYGEWMGLFTGDADVFFEPEVYTKDAEDITKVSALLAGVWFEGTDDIEEKGFEYWALPRSNTRAAGGDVQTVVVSGNKMTATIEGLKPGATYAFRSYAKTASDTTYGEEKTFKTILIGDVDGDGVLTKADTDAIAKHIIGQTPTGFNKKMADVNDDGDVNTTDIVLLINIIE